DREAAFDGEVTASGIAKAAHAKDLMAAQKHAAPAADAARTLADQLDLGARAGDADARGVRYHLQRRSLEQDLQRGRVVGIAGNAIGQSMACAIERARYGHAKSLIAVAAEILDGRVHPGRHDLDSRPHTGSSVEAGRYSRRSVADRILAKASRSIGSNSTASPGANSAGGEASASKIWIGVVPMRCQPPGLSSG